MASNRCRRTHIARAMSEVSSSGHVFFVVFLATLIVMAFVTSKIDPDLEDRSVLSIPNKIFMVTPIAEA